MWRRCWAVDELRICVFSATTVQAQLRMWLARQLLLISLAAAVRLQAGARGMAAREKLRDLAFAATCLQAEWRRHDACRLLLCARGAIVSIQSSARQLLASKEARGRRIAVIDVPGASPSVAQTS